MLITNHPTTGAARALVLAVTLAAASASAPAAAQECGNGVVEAGEACDDGLANGTTSCGCTASCEYAFPGMFCGDQSDTECDNPDACDGSGSCLPNPEGLGTTCGDSSQSPCDGPDFCDGAGSCVPNFEEPFTLCGDLSDTACDRPDTCDGSGSCQANYEIQGASCGDASDTPCDNPDSCNGAGLCQPHYESEGTPCGDATAGDCFGTDFCDATGTCLDSGLLGVGAACGTLAIPNATTRTPAMQAASVSTIQRRPIPGATPPCRRCRSLEQSRS